MTGLPTARRDWITGLGVALTAALIGLAIPAALDDDRTLGLAFLALVAITAFGAFALRVEAVRRAGPGLALAVGALATAFLIGFLGGDQRRIAHENTVVILSAASVLCVLAGGVLRGALARPRAPRWPGPGSPVPLNRRTLLWIATAIVALSALHLASNPGGIPLLASNVDSARFSGGGGSPVRLIFVFLIGGLQWVAAIGLVTWLVRRERPRGWPLALTLVAAFLLILLASRSLIFTPLLTLALAAAVTGRLRPSRMAALAVIGLVALGLAGQLRSTSSGATEADLRAAGYDGITGQITGSSAVGPWVFGKVLDRVPALHPHRGGAFFTADFRAQFPGDQVFGDPELPDEWVTRIRGATYGQDGVGGSPPTLPGGLYIDWGIPGIVIGCLIVGWLLAAIYDWARRVGTIGALALYAYFTGYIMLSAYNFLSLKPLALTAMVLCFITHRVEVGARVRARRSAPAVARAA